MPSANPRARLMVVESAIILQRLYFLLRECLLMKAGWLPGIEHWESKLILPELLWQDALIVEQLRERILELRYPERRMEQDQDSPLLSLMRSTRNAPNGASFMASYARVIKPTLHRLAHEYLKVADALDDGPTVHLLQHARLDWENQLPALEQAAAGYLRVYPEQAEAAWRWKEAADRALGALTPEVLFAANLPLLEPLAYQKHGGKDLQISRRGGRDKRFRAVRFAWPDRYDRSHPPGEGRELQVRQAVHHINEVWAAEMAAACVFDLAEAAPLAFWIEGARWCYDEIRHCRMGYTRLLDWGFSMEQIPLDSFSYDAGADVDPLVRLGIIFFFETTYIHTKSERMHIFDRIGDRLSSHDMDFDWADELIHTAYGKRWLTHFLKDRHDRRTLSSVKEEAERCVQRLQASATDADKTSTRKVYHDLLRSASSREEVSHHRLEETFS